MSRSNCLFGAFYIRARLGGSLSWRPGWRGPSNNPNGSGWEGFLGNPWGHWRVLYKGRVLSFSADDKNLAWWRQVWFEGRLRVSQQRG